MPFFNSFSFPKIDDEWYEYLIEWVSIQHIVYEEKYENNQLSSNEQSFTGKNGEIYDIVDYSNLTEKITELGENVNAYKNIFYIICNSRRTNIKYVLFSSGRKGSTPEEKNDYVIDEAFSFNMNAFTGLTTFLKTFIDKVSKDCTENINQRYALCGHSTGCVLSLYTGLLFFNSNNDLFQKNFKIFAAGPFKWLTTGEETKKYEDLKNINVFFSSIIEDLGYPEEIDEFLFIKNIDKTVLQRHYFPLINLNNDFTTYIIKTVNRKKYFQEESIYNKNISKDTLKHNIQILINQKIGDLHSWEKYYEYFFNYIKNNHKIYYTKDTNNKFNYDINKFKYDMKPYKFPETLVLDEPKKSFMSGFNLFKGTKPAAAEKPTEGSPAAVAASVDASATATAAAAATAAATENNTQNPIAESTVATRPAETVQQAETNKKSFMGSIANIKMPSFPTLKMRGGKKSRNKKSACKKRGTQNKKRKQKSCKRRRK